MPQLSAKKAKVIKNVLEFNRVESILKGIVSADTYSEIDAQLNDSPPRIDNPNQKYCAQGNSLLNFMIMQNNKNAVDVLLSAGGDVDHRDDYGQTALGAALTTYMLNIDPNTGRADGTILKDIIKKSSKESLLAPDSNNEGTIFDMLSLRGINSPEMYQAAIDRFKELEPETPIKDFVNVADSNGNTVLHRLAQKGQVDKIKMLTKSMSPEDKLQSFNTVNNDNLEPFWYVSSDDNKTGQWIIGEMQESQKLVLESKKFAEEIKQKEELANKMAAELEQEALKDNDEKKKKRKKKKGKKKNNKSSDANNDLDSVNLEKGQVKEPNITEADKLGLAIDNLTTLLINGGNDVNSEEYLSKISGQIKKIGGYSAGLETLRDNVTSFQVAGTKKTIQQVISEK